MAANGAQRPDGEHIEEAQRDAQGHSQAGTESKARAGTGWVESEATGVLTGLMGLLPATKKATAHGSGRQAQPTGLPTPPNVIQEANRGARAQGPGVIGTFYIPPRFKRQIHCLADTRKQASRAGRACPGRRGRRPV